MKKALLPALLLTLCLLMSSCFLVVSRPVQSVPVDPQNLGEAKTFSKAGITLQLTDRFEEEVSQLGYDGYYTSDFCGVVVIREPFSAEEGLSEKTPEAYLQAVIDHNGHQNIRPQQADGLWFYVNYNNSAVRCVYSYAYKGSDAFYVVQYILNQTDEDALRTTIHSWALATSVS